MYEYMYNDLYREHQALLEIQKCKVPPHLAFSKQCPPEIVETVVAALERGWVSIAYDQQS